jgi:hypothetical protein
VVDPGGRPRFSPCVSATASHPGTDAIRPRLPAHFILPVEEQTAHSIVHVAGSTEAHPKIYANLLLLFAISFQEGAVLSQSSKAALLQ